MFRDGVWFYEEWKFAKELGYGIQVIKGNNYYCIETVFNDYVDDL